MNKWLIFRGAKIRKYLKIMYILKLLEVMVVDNAVPILFFLIINILLSLSIAERWVLKSSIVVELFVSL